MPPFSLVGNHEFARISHRGHQIINLLLPAAGPEKLMAYLDLKSGPGGQALDRSAIGHSGGRVIVFHRNFPVKILTAQHGVNALIFYEHFRFSLPGSHADIDSTTEHIDPRGL